MRVNFVLNGSQVSFDINPNEHLAPVLRRNGILSIKVGCNESSCGACTILVDNKPVLACSFLAIRAEGKNILTVEGIQQEASRIADFFADEGADQCGYCTPGHAMIIHALKEEYKDRMPSDEEIKNYLVGNLCRCSGYQSQLIAVKNYLKECIHG